MKKWWDKFKEIIYLITIVGMGAGWYAQAKISKKMSELKDQAQDAKLEIQETRIHELEAENTKIRGYAKENADNIVWLIRVYELSE